MRDFCLFFNGNERLKEIKDGNSKNMWKHTEKLLIGHCTVINKINSKQNTLEKEK